MPVIIGHQHHPMDQRIEAQDIIESSQLLERPVRPQIQIQNRNYNSVEDYMNAFEIKMYDINYNQFRQEECTFDFEPFINQQIAIVKNCRHIFHLECIRGYIDARFHRDRRIQ